MFEERHRRSKMKLESGAVYYLDLVECLSSSLYIGLYSRRWKEMAFYQHQPFFFESPLFVIDDLVLNSSLLSLKLSETA